MMQGENTLSTAQVYQYKLLINMLFFSICERFFSAFHRWAQGARLFINLKTLTDMRGA